MGNSGIAFALTNMIRGGLPFPHSPRFPSRALSKGGQDFEIIHEISKFPSDYQDSETFLVWTSNKHWKMAGIGGKPWIHVFPEFYMLRAKFMVLPELGSF